MKKTVDISIFILVVLLAAYLIVTFVGERTRVNGVSMENTLYDGDNIMMDKLSYRFREVERFDVICFYAGEAKENLIKRVIGLPGETIRISGGTIYVDDEPLNDYYGGISFAGRAEEGVTLGPEEYFVLGDNRMESIDSRYEQIGNVKKKEIMGRAGFVFYPFSRIRVIK